MGNTNEADAVAGPRLRYARPTLIAIGATSADGKLSTQVTETTFYVSAYFSATLGPS